MIATFGLWVFFFLAPRQDSVMLCGMMPFPLCMCAQKLLSAPWLEIGLENGLLHAKTLYSLVLFRNCKLGLIEL